MPAPLKGAWDDFCMELTTLWKLTLDRRRFSTQGLLLSRDLHNPERLVRPQFDSPQKKKNALESVSAYPLTVDFKTLTDVDLLVVFRTYQLRM